MICVSFSRLDKSKCLLWVSVKLKCQKHAAEQTSRGLLNPVEGKIMETCSSRLTVVQQALRLWLKLSLVESLPAFRRLVIFVWLQNTLEMKAPRSSETSETTRITWNHMLEVDSSASLLWETQISHNSWLSLALAKYQNLEAKGDHFECYEYCRMILFIKLKAPVITSSWSKKCRHYFPGQFRVPPDNFLYKWCT